MDDAPLSEADAEQIDSLPTTSTPAVTMSQATVRAKDLADRGLASYVSPSSQIPAPALDAEPKATKAPQEAPTQSNLVEGLPQQPEPAQPPAPKPSIPGLDPDPVEAAQAKYDAAREAAGQSMLATKQKLSELGFPPVNDDALADPAALHTHTQASINRALADPSANKQSAYGPNRLSPEADQVQQNLRGLGDSAASAIGDHAAAIASLRDSYAALQAAKQPVVPQIPGLSEPSSATSADSATHGNPAGGLSLPHESAGDVADPSTPKPATPDSAILTPSEEQKWTAQSIEEAKAGKRSYGVTPDNQFSISESTPLASMTEAVKDGVLPSPPPEVWKAVVDKQALIDAAGSNPKIKAALAGAGRGAAFLASAPVGAGVGGAALSETVVGAPIGALIGGLISGTAGSWAYGKIVDELAKHNDTINSFVASQRLHPGYAAAGELATFGAGLPRALVKGAGEGLSRIADTLASKSNVPGATTDAIRASINAADIAKKAGLTITPAVERDAYSRAASALDAIGKSYASSGGGLVQTVENFNNLAKVAANRGDSAGAIAAAIGKRVATGAAAMLVIDTTLKEGGRALGLSDEGQTLGGAGTALLLGALASGHGIAPKGYDNTQLGNIFIRGVAHDATGTAMGEKVDAAKLAGTPGVLSHVTDEMTHPLTPEEQEIYDTFSKKALKLIGEGKIAADPSQWQSNAQQILFAGRKGGIASVDIQPKEKKATGRVVGDEPPVAPQDGSTATGQPVNPQTSGAPAVQPPAGQQSPGLEALSKTPASPSGAPLSQPPSAPVVPGSVSQANVQSGSSSPSTPEEQSGQVQPGSQQQPASPEVAGVPAIQRAVMSGVMTHGEASARLQKLGLNGDDITRAIGPAPAKEASSPTVATPADELAQLQRQVADSTALQEQAKREGNAMAVAIHGKEIADARNRLAVLESHETAPQTSQEVAPSDQRLAPEPEQAREGVPASQEPATAAGRASIPGLEPTEAVTPPSGERPVTPSASAKDIQRKLIEAQLDGDDTDTAFRKAGYQNVDGFWVHPHVDPEFVRQLSPETKQRLRDGGVKFFDHIDPNEGNAGQMVLMSDGTRGVGVRSDASIGADAFTRKNETVLHELGHHIWQQELTPEQRADFAKQEPQTEHGKRLAKGGTKYDQSTGIYRDGMLAEEEFAERFAENGGDLQKTLSNAGDGSQEPITNSEPVSSSSETKTGENITTGEAQPPPAPSSNRYHELTDLNSQQLDEKYRAVKESDKNLERELFGEEGAKRYRTLLSRENSHDSKISDAAYAERSAMEEKLNEKQRNRLFGVGDDGYISPEEIRDIHGAVNFVENADSAEDLGNALKFAAVNFDPDVKGADLTFKQAKALAEMKAAARLIQEKGWNPNEVAQSMIRHAASRFSDPNDAGFMLDKLMRYFGRNEAPSVEAPASKAPLTIPGLPAVPLTPEQAKRVRALKLVATKRELKPAEQKELDALEPQQSLSKQPEQAQSTPSHEQPTAETQKEVTRSDEGSGSRPAENEVRSSDGSLDGGRDGERSSSEPAGQAEPEPHTLTEASKPLRELKRGKLKNEFARLETELHEGDADSRMFATVGNGERITFNPKRVAATMDLVRSRGLEPKKWLQAALEEELIRARQLTFSRSAFEKRYAALWKSLPKPVRDLVSSIYVLRDAKGNVVSPDSAPHVMGAEAERMIVQAREIGTFSELLSGEEGAEKLLPLLLAPHNDLIEHSIANVESLTSVPEIPGLESPVAESAQYTNPVVTSETPKEVTQTEVSKPAEAAAEIKAELAPASNNKRPPKEIKSELISRLKEAIKSAPNTSIAERRDLEKTLAGTPPDKQPDWMVKNMGGEKWLKEYTARWESAQKRLAELPKEIGHVSFHIPGDGTFKLLNTKENLAELLRRVEKMPAKAPSSNPPVRVGSNMADSRSAKTIAKDTANPQLAARDYARDLVNYPEDSKEHEFAKSVLDELRKRGGVDVDSEIKAANDLLNGEPNEPKPEETAVSTKPEVRPDVPEQRSVPVLPEQPTTQPGKGVAASKSVAKPSPETFAERRKLSEQWLNTLSPERILAKMNEYGIPAKRTQRTWDKAANRSPGDETDFAENFMIDAGDDLAAWEKKAKPKDLAANEPRALTPKETNRLRQLNLIESKRPLRPEEEQERNAIQTKTQEPKTNEQSNITKTDANPTDRRASGRAIANTGGTSSDNGAAYPKLSPVESARAILGTRDRLAREIERIGGIHLRPAGKEIIPNGLGMSMDGVLYHNFEALAESASRIAPERRSDYLESAFTEELIHRADHVTNTQHHDEQEEIFQGLPPEMQSMVRDFYPSTSSESALGAEYLRALVQARSGRFVTEEHYKDVSDFKAALSDEQTPLAEKKVARIMRQLGWSEHELKANEPHLTNEDASRKLAHDPITGTNSRLSTRQVDRETAGRISADNEGKLGRVGKLVQDANARAADGSAVRAITPAQWSAALDQPELSAEARAQVLALKRLSEGSEGVVTTDGQFAYKVYSLKDDAGTGIGLIGKLARTPEGKLGLLFHRGSIADVVDKASVLSHLGVPTEVLGINSTGEVVTKQPIADQQRWSSRIVSELSEMGAVPVPIAVHESDEASAGSWMVNVAGRHYIVSDIAPRNVMGNTSGASRPVDVVLTPISEADFAAHPELAEARKDVRPLEPDQLFANEPNGGKKDDDDLDMSPHHSQSQPRDKSGSFAPDSELGPEKPHDVEKMVRDFMAGNGKNRSETFAEKQARKDSMLSAENRLASKLGIEPKTEPTPAMRALAEEVAKHKEEKPGAVETAKEVAKGITGRLKEIKHSLTELPQYGPVLKAVNEYQADLQRASKEAQDIAEAITKKAPEPLTREAITNWRQAGGDWKLLSEWAQATTDPKLKAGYQAAMELSADHKALARDISALYNEKLALGKEEEMLQEGVANYATQIWVDDNGRKLPTGGAGKFKQQFAYSNPRQFDNFFEGEQMAAWAKGNGEPGFKPLTKDAAALVGIYSAEFNKVLASRNLIRKLAEIKDADGRAIVAPSSMSKILGTIKPGEPTDLTSGAFEITRQSGKDTADYKLPDHPAFQKWKFLEPQYKEDAEGLEPPVATGNKQLMMGNLVVHPKHARFINNVLGDSAIRQWLNEPSEGFTGASKAVISGILRANGFTKGLMFMGSPFHAIHVGKRALGNGINPFGLGEDLDFSDPMQRWAIEHGLVVHADRLGQQQFVEGLGTSDWVKKIPGIGPILTAASDFTFHTYIPRMKMKTFGVLMQRKLKNYAKELKDGTITVDQLGAKAAYETNGIFGHMNYSGMGRNKTVQHVLSMLVLAPDFTESTFRTFADVFTKHGGEARRGLLALAIGTFVVAKIINALLDDGDPHLDHPFSIVHGTREYSLRSPVSDIMHLYKDWWSFAAGRQSPFLRGLIEAGSGKNWRGEPVKWSEAARDVLTQPIPMTVKALPGVRDLSPTDAKSPIKGWEQFVASLGFGIRRYSPSQDVYKLADEYLKAHGQNNPTASYPQSKYANLKYALFDGKMSAAKEEYQKLVAQQGEKKVADGFKSSLFHPVMANKAMLADFLKTLSPAQQKNYQAAMTERDAAWQRFSTLRGTVAPAPAPAQAAQRKPFVPTNAWQRMKAA